MANELTPSGQWDVAPYHAPSPGLPATAPVPSQDYLSERAVNPGQGPTQLFGVPLPAGANAYHIDAAISHLAGIFATDMPQLGSGPQFIQQAITVFRQLSSQPVPHDPASHGYNLSDLLSPISTPDLPYVSAFANAMWRVNASEKDVRNAVYWLGLLYQKLEQAQAPARPTGAEPVTDAELQKVIKHNDQAIQSGQDELKARWGYQYESNMALVKKYFASLSPREQQGFENAVVDGRMALNHPDIIEGLYKQATAGAPKSAVGVESEIAEIEKILRTDRKRYNSDSAMQARLRDLYDLRGN